MKQCKTCFRKVLSVDLNIDGKCPICVRYTRINDDIATMNITLIEALKIIEAQKDHIRRLESNNDLITQAEPGALMGVTPPKPVFD